MKFIISIATLLFTLNIFSQGNNYTYKSNPPEFLVKAISKVDSLPEGKCILKGNVEVKLMGNYQNAKRRVKVAISNNVIWTDENGDFELIVNSGKQNIKVYLPDTSANADTVSLYDNALLKKEGSINLVSGYKMDLKTELTNIIQPVPEEIFPEEDPQIDVSYKPVIYLYPPQKQKVELKLNINGSLRFDYPKYNIENGWDVIANPKGEIEINDNKYDYLFWEGNHPSNLTTEKDFATGFVIKGIETISFLEEKLKEMNLSPSEMNDFITFWAPIMIENEYNFIHFKFTDDYNVDVAGIKVTPQPDSIYRMLMVFQPLKEFKVVKPQVIEKANRNGFTVIEWGGTKVDSNSKMKL